MRCAWKITYGRKGDSKIAWITAGAIAGGAILGSLSTDKASGSQQDAAKKGVEEIQRESDLARSDLAPYRQAGQAALTRLSQMLGLGSPGGIDESDPRYQAMVQNMMTVLNQQHIARFGMPIAASPDKAGVQRTIDANLAAVRQNYISQYGADTGTPGDVAGSPLLRKFASSDLESDPVYQSGLEFGLNEGTKGLERRAAAAGGYDSGAALKALTRFGNDYGSTKANESYGRFKQDQSDVFSRLSAVSGMGSGATNVGVGVGANAGTNLAGLYTGAGNAAGAADIARGNIANNALNNFTQYRLLSQLSPGGQRTASPSPIPSDLYAG